MPASKEFHQVKAALKNSYVSHFHADSITRRGNLFIVRHKFAEWPTNQIIQEWIFNIESSLETATVTKYAVDKKKNLRIWFYYHQEAPIWCKKCGVKIDEQFDLCVDCFLDLFCPPKKEVKC